MIEAAGVLIVDGRGRVLLLQRSDEARDYRGFWSIPGGMVQDGESPAEAATRSPLELGL